MLGFIGIVSAQWSTIPSENLMIAPDGEEPRMCSDGEGGAYVVWSNFSYVKTRIYLQHVNKYGIKSLVTPMIVCDTSDLQRERTIVEDGYGGAIIMVSAYKIIGQIGGFNITNTTIYLQRINKSLTKLWGENGLRVSTRENNQDCYAYPKIVSDKKNNAYIFFGDRRDTVNGEAYNLYMQRIRYDGKRMWGDSGISVATNVVTPKWFLMKSLSDRIIAWYVQPWGRLVSYDTLGNKLWLLDTEYKAYYHLEVVNNDKFFATRQYSADGAVKTFQANLFDSNGDSTWSEWRTIADSSNFNFVSSNVKIMYDTVLVINYPKLNFQTNLSEYYLQAITVSGELLYSNQKKYAGVNSKSYRPADLTVSNNGDFIALHSFPTDSTFNTYAQKINIYGDLLWDSLGVLLSNKMIPNYGGIYYYYIISDNIGGAIALGSNEPNKGIYLQQINKNGDIGSVLTTVSKNNYFRTPSSLELSQNYPNPFNPTTTIRYQLPAKNVVILKIYDLLAREITTLVNEQQDAGTYSAQWNASQFSSGIYVAVLRVGNFTAAKKLLLMK